MRTRLLFFLPVFWACSSDPVTIPVCPANPPAAALTALTFNTGLGPGLDVKYPTPRIPLVAQAVAAAPWDILCLDETWLDVDHDAVLAALNLPADQIVTGDTRGQNEDPADRCLSGELDNGLACMRSKCGGVPDEDVTMCAKDQCQTEGFELYVNAPHCFQCVIASAGLSANAIAQTCNGAGASRMYGGRNGVILASRLPISNAEWIPLPSSDANRVGLFATVDVHGTPVEVACTHLTGNVDIIPPSNHQFPTWYDEMKTQIDLISKRLAERARGGPQFFLGDLNNGPKYTGDMVPDGQEVWNEIAAQGFTSPAAETVPPTCSRCDDNLISPTTGRYLIDHVLTRGNDAFAPVCAARAMDQPVTLTDLQGNTVTTNLSDHDAITVRFNRK